MGRFGASLLAIGAVATLGGAFLVGGAAAADLVTYYHAGAWDAFSGRGDDGRLVCGIGNTNPADGRRLMLRFTIGGEDVTFSATKPAWTIPANTPAPVVMQVGLDTPWTQQATGNAQMMSWTLDRTAIQAFDAQFRRASSMTLTFPDGNEPPWTVPLTGSTAISNAFGRCITDLTQRTRATGGAPPSAAPSQGPTQPFATPPAGDAAPPPAPSGTAPTGAGASQPTAPR
ncbi:MAG: hypothetical protein P4L71_02540 [Acetobacteraceae bacterium]|nr:hypothetical protein [Acetobacteraceae bacterium]